MKKTVDINLGGLIFHIDEDAYQRLDQYLETLKSQFAQTEGSGEIINDVEIRIAELFKEKTEQAKQVINLEDVQEVIAILGQPEDYLQEDSETEDTHSQHKESSYERSYRRIYRDTDNRWLGGVSSGLGAYFGIDPVWIRLLFLALLFTGGFGILSYLVLWLVIPKATTTAEKLQMRGKPVTLSNIEQFIKDEARSVNKSVKDFTRGSGKVNFAEARERGKGFFANLGNFIVDFFTLVFRFLFKALGFLFILIGFILLFSVVIALFTGGIEIMGLGYGPQHIFSFLKLLSTGPLHYNLFLTGFILMMAVPLVILVYYGIRLLFRTKPMNRAVKGGLALTAIIGFVLLTISAIRLVQNNSSNGHYERQIQLTDSVQTWQLSAIQDSVYNQIAARNFERDWIPAGKNNFFKDVELDIRPSGSGYSYLNLITEAEGSSHLNASHIARKTLYEPVVKNDSLKLPVYYSLGEREKFHFQEVEATLYLKPGTRVYLHDNMMEILDNIDNLNDLWAPDMVDHYWLMTPRGLLCSDCPGTKEVVEKLKSDTAATSGNDKSDMRIRFQVDGDGVHFELKNQQDSSRQE